MASEYSAIDGLSKTIRKKGRKCKEKTKNLTKYSFLRKTSQNTVNVFLLHLSHGPHAFAIDCSHVFLELPVQEKNQNHILIASIYNVSKTCNLSCCLFCFSIGITSHWLICGRTCWEKGPQISNQRITLASLRGAPCSSLPERAIGQGPGAETGFKLSKTWSWAVAWCSLQQADTFKSGRCFSTIIIQHCYGNLESTASWRVRSKNVQQCHAQTYPMQGRLLSKRCVLKLYWL